MGCLRRAAALAPTEEHNLHYSFFHQYYKVSAVARFSLDDDRAWDYRFVSLRTTTRDDGGAASIQARLRNFFVTFGRVPLFFYLLQWFTAHTIALLLNISFGKPWKWLFKTPMDWQYQPGMGFNLIVVYACWIGGVLLLYPLCKWFAGVKARRRDWWLSYL